MDFNTFIDWMRGSGVNVIIGFLLSFGVEWFPQWTTMADKIKRLVMFTLCLLIPLLGTLIGVLFGTLDAGFVVSWWPALVAGFAAFSTSTMAHMVTKPSVRGLRSLGK